MLEQSATNDGSLLGRGQNTAALKALIQLGRCRATGEETARKSRQYRRRVHRQLALRC